MEMPDYFPCNELEFNYFMIISSQIFTDKSNFFPNFHRQIQFCHTSQ